VGDDPHVREIGRITDEQGREIVVGISYGAVTLRTLHTRTDGAVTLRAYQAEEFAQLFTSACWQAGWQSAQPVPEAGDGHA
jgi:hypothetical protein